MGIWEQLGLDMARHRMVALVGAGGGATALHGGPGPAAGPPPRVAVARWAGMMNHTRRPRV